MSTPFDGIDQFAAAVMAKVLADGNGTVDWCVSTNALAWQASPPRVVFVPSRGSFGAAQKSPRGSTGRSVGTRFAGARVWIWGDDPTGAVSSIRATEILLRRVCSQMVLTGGPSPFFELTSEEWVERTGQTDLGEVVIVTIALAVDLHTPPLPSVVVTSVALDPSRSTAGDGLVDAGEP